MKRIILVGLFLIPTTSFAHKGIPEAIKSNVEQCMGFGYKQNCCVSSYSRTAAGAMDNHLRHAQIAKCSGVSPKG
jgi:hypothetical protein